MNATSKLLLVGALAVLAGGCVRKSEYDAHVAKYQGLKTALADWAVKVNYWEGLTKNVICDVISVNSPDPTMTYAVQTQKYCTGTTEGDGVPPTPPDFGSF